MRFDLPKIGDVRRRSSFLFFPKRIDAKIIWLEKAEWTEEYIFVPAYKGSAKRWVVKVPD